MSAILWTIMIDAMVWEAIDSCEDQSFDSVLERSGVSADGLRESMRRLALRHYYYLPAVGAS